MVHYEGGFQGTGTAAPPGLGAPPVSASAGQKPPLVPVMSPKPTPGAGSSPRQPRNPKLIFKYAYHSRAELDSISRNQGSQSDGVEPVKENRRRRNYVAWMTQITQELHLPHDVLSTAVVYMHRYFAVKSMEKTDIWLMGLAALFTASKSENNPIALDRFINMVLKLSRDGTPVIDAFKPPRYKVLTRLRASKERQALLRDWLLTAERGLLYTLGFKFNVVHPNYTIVNAAKTWRLEDFVLSQPGMPKLSAFQSGLDVLPFVQVTTLALQYPPEKLGIACLEFALQMMAQKNPPMAKAIPKLRVGQHWWEGAGMTQAEMADIRSQLLEVVSIEGPPAESTTMLEKVTPANAAPQGLGAAPIGSFVPPPTPGGAAEALPAIESPGKCSDASDTTGAAARCEGDSEMASSASLQATDLPAVKAESLISGKRKSPDSLGPIDEPVTKRASVTREIDSVVITEGVNVAGSGLDMVSTEDSMEPGELVM